VYRGGEVVARDIPIAEVSDWLDDDGAVVWVDLCQPSRADLVTLATELGLHELAVDDALSPHQRPKLDRYQDHLFFTCHATSADPHTFGLVETEVDAFLAERWLITVRKGPEFDIDHVLARWDQASDLASHGVAFLLYGLLDVVIDGYFDTLDVLDAYFDEVSEEIFAEHPIDQRQQLELFRMRRALVRFHRLAVPIREALSALMRREHGLVPEALFPYYQDVYDHILRVTESTDALRDLVTTIVETNLSMRDYRQNQIMKKVTSWAAIIAVPTLITGFYGMNVPYPGFARDSGALTATALMVALSATLFVIFRKKEWL
jgi:magnesium transporter